MDSIQTFLLSHQSPLLKRFIGVFVLVISIGFFSSLQFVNLTTEATPKGIEENYLGNENDLEAEEMKFEKSEKQILSIVHSHILSMSVLFFLLGGLVYATQNPKGLKSFLMIEPLISVLATFGGIYFLTKGYTWMVYVVMVSGTLMTLSWVLSIGVIYWELGRRKVD